MIKLGELFKKRRMVIFVTGLLVIGITATLLITTRTINSITADDPNPLMSSLGYTYEMLEIIQKNTTPYVGNNSKVGAIVNQLPATWKGLSYDSFSLTTDEEPYGLTINYKETSENSFTDYLDNPFPDAMEENNALLLFASIDNLAEVTLIKLTGTQILTFTRGEINKIFDGIPSFDDLTNIYNKLSNNLMMDEFYFSHPGRLYLFDAKPEDVIYRYSVEPDRLFTNKSGLTVYQYYSSYDPIVFYFNGSGLYARKELYPDSNETYSDIVAKFVDIPAQEVHLHGQIGPPPRQQVHLHIRQRR
jgi:hypothetical protein